MSLWNFHLLKERILNSVNKDPASLTAGGCDRVYWGWKLKDFPDVSKQYALYPFGLLMDAENRYEVDIFRSMVSFWAKTIQPNGSVDQCFPGERSIGPTLYALNAVLLSYEKIRACFDEREMDGLNQCMRRSCCFARQHPEHYGYIANHHALFAYSYLLAWKIFKEEADLRAYENEIAEITQHFQEGWFLEYETADPGYQTQCLHYLTLCYELTEDKQLRKMILSGIEEFIAYFIFPDGSYSGLFSGRGTEILYPYPLFYWQRESEICEQAVSFLYKVKNGQRLVKWHGMAFDNCIRVGANYLLCSQDYENTKPLSDHSRLPCFAGCRKEWPDAGLLVLSDEHKHLAVNFKRGGVFKLVPQNGSSLIEDTGYVVQSGKDKWASSIFCSDARYTMDDAHTCSMTHAFFSMSDKYQGIWVNVLLRILSVTLLRLPFFADFLKGWMVRILIKNKRVGTAVLKRQMKLASDEIVISDSVAFHSNKSGYRTCALGSRSIPFHMACAGFHHQGKNHLLLDYEIKETAFQKHMEIETRLSFKAGQVLVARTTQID